MSDFDYYEFPGQIDDEVIEAMVETMFQMAKECELDYYAELDIITDERIPFPEIPVTQTFDFNLVDCVPWAENDD